MVQPHDEKQLGTEARHAGLWAALALVLALVAAVPALALGLPLNDGFGHAARLTGSRASAVGTNLAATKQPGEPAHAGDPGGASVWYSWTPDRGGPAQANTCSAATTFDTVVAVYTRDGAVPPFSHLVRVAANDDGCPGGRSLVDFQAKAGTTYYVAVDGAGGAAGAFRLNVGEVSRYAGTTSQGQAIRFRLSDDRKRVTALVASVTAKCQLTAGPTTSDTIPIAGLPALSLRHGGFAGAVGLTRDGVYQQKRVRGARAGQAFHGIVRYETSGIGGSCDSRRVTWSARPVRLRGIG